MNTAQLKKMTVKTLKAMCKEMKIKGYSKCKKALLISMIEEKQTPVVVEEIKEPTPVPVIVEEIKEPTPEPTLALPLNLDTDITGFEEFVKPSPIVEEELDEEHSFICEKCLNRKHESESVSCYGCGGLICEECNNITKKYKECEKCNYHTCGCKCECEPIIEEDEILSDLDDLIENYDEALQKQEEVELAQMKKELLEKIEQEQKAEQEKDLNKMTEQLVNNTIKQSKQEVQDEKPKPKPKSIKKLKKSFRKPRKVIQQPIVIDLSTISLEDLMAEAKKRGYVMNKYVAPKTIDNYQHRILANTIDD